MTRNEWKDLSRRIRESARKGATDRSDMIGHGGTYWTVSYEAHGLDKGWFMRPSILGDRSLSSRIAVEMAWARQYRRDAVRHARNGEYFAPHRSQAIKAALLCVASSKLMRISESRGPFERAFAQGEAIGRMMANA